MFNRTVIENHTEYVPYEKEVTINRAPTDESVALLKDMEKSIMNKVVAQLTIKNNDLDVNGLFIQNDLPLNSYTFYGIFKMNGTTYKFNAEIDHFDLHEANLSYDRTNAVIKIIFDKISKVISGMLLEKYVKDIIIKIK